MPSIQQVGLALAGLALALAGASFAIQPREPVGDLAAREFFAPELYVSSSNVALEEVLPDLPNRAAWESFAATRPAGAAPVRAFIDPRSGAATSVLGAFPLLPGPGVGNRVTLSDLAARLGRAVTAVDRQAVADAVLAFAREHRDLLAVDTAQLGDARADQVTPSLWQVSIPQVYRGVRVRDGRLAAAISHGNLIVVGTEAWGDVRGLSTHPAIASPAALEAGFRFAGGRSPADRILRGPALEIVPTAPPAHQEGEGFAGPVGAGYGHRLVWTYLFQRGGEPAAWEVIVDARSGEVLAFQDKNHYVARQISGGVYPLTATEVCPADATCGDLRPGWPMPFADTGLAFPDDFANSAGIFEPASGTAATTLTGRYVGIADTCGEIRGSAAGAIDLGGVNGDHDCVSGGGSAGNTASSRSAYYELNKLAEIARGWLPGNAFLQSRLTANVNLEATCNAFYEELDGTINFYRSGGGCRNTGEIAGILDHEWGHALDDNDAGGALSNSTEGYADIAALYRLQASCIGHGLFATVDKRCGTTVDGTGYNQNEAQIGPPHCDLDCSGVRDADWDRHADHTPDTPASYVCRSCGLPSAGPCGRQVHCASAPARQAAWDLAARDLRGAPFGYDRQTAFLVASKLFYQGSGNVGLWHACTCPGSSDGCGATNAYIQWLAADDDDGSLENGTPHMTALHAAFDRHGIACPMPPPVDSGCAGNPAAPPLAVSAADHRASLSWGAVAGATRYWVFRTEGHAGCDLGKALIAETTGTSYTDPEVANGREYHYNVVAVGSSNACFGPVSNCAGVIPSPTCLSGGASCSSNGQCCSGRCRGGKTRTCR